MSHDKDPDAPAGTPGRARASLAQIRQMWSADLDERADCVIRVGMFGRREVWRKVPGQGTGANAVFELQQDEGD
jgi:hypothetical protein